MSTHNSIKPKKSLSVKILFISKMKFVIVIWHKCVGHIPYTSDLTPHPPTPSNKRPAPFRPPFFSSKNWQNNMKSLFAGFLQNVTHLNWGIQYFSLSLYFVGVCPAVHGAWFCMFDTASQSVFFYFDCTAAFKMFSFKFLMTRIKTKC